jgi:hypothetical protein
LRRLSECGACIVLGCTAVSWCLAQQHDTFSQVLQRALRSSADRFRDLEGVRIENRKRHYFFEAKVYLPEASYCRVFNQEGPVYCCEWRDKGYSASKTRYQNLIQNIESSLGPGWTKTVKSGKLRNEVLFRAERRPVVQAILDSEPPETYVLVLPAEPSRDGFVGKIPSMEEFAHP